MSDIGTAPERKCARCKDYVSLCHCPIGTRVGFLEEVTVHEQNTTLEGSERRTSVPAHPAVDHDALASRDATLISAVTAHAQELMQEISDGPPSHASVGWCDPSLNEPMCDECNALEAKIVAALLAATREADSVWKDAVIDAAVVDWIYTEEHETNPRKAVNDLLTWQTKLALDPAVSKEACDLVERAEAAEARIDRLEKNRLQLLVDNEAAEAKADAAHKERKDARLRAYRQARVFEPSMDSYHAAMAVYAAAFGLPDGEPTVVLPNGETKQGWQLTGESAVNAARREQREILQKLIKESQAETVVYGIVTSNATHWLRRALAALEAAAQGEK